MNGENLSIAELVCELTRNCNLKEENFAAGFNLSPTEVRLLTHILISLEEKNLVSRIQDVNDKRIILVKLRPKAHLLINNLKESYDDLHKRILQNLTKEEMKNIISSFSYLTALPLFLYS